jgi:hypothetical protein
MHTGGLVTQAMVNFAQASTHPNSRCGHTYNTTAHQWPCGEVPGELTITTDNYDTQLIYRSHVNMRRAYICRWP